MGRRHNESEIRGMVEVQRQSLERVAVACKKDGYESTAFALTEALKWVQEAKVRAAGEGGEE